MYTWPVVVEEIWKCYAKKRGSTACRRQQDRDTKGVEEERCGKGVFSSPSDKRIWGHVPSSPSMVRGRALAENWFLSIFEVRKKPLATPFSVGQAHILSHHVSMKYLLEGRCSKRAMPKDTVGVPVANWRTGSTAYVHGQIHVFFYMLVLYLVKTSDTSLRTLQRWPLPVHLATELQSSNFFNSLLKLFRFQPFVRKSRN